MLIFCPTDLDEGSGSGAENKSKIFSPRVDLECQTDIHAVDASTLFFVLNNDVLPDYEHNLTYSVSDGDLIAYVWRHTISNFI